MGVYLLIYPIQVHNQYGLSGLVVNTVNMPTVAAEKDVFLMNRTRARSLASTIRIKQTTVTVQVVIQYTVATILFIIASLARQQGAYIAMKPTAVTWQALVNLTSSIFPQNNIAFSPEKMTLVTVPRETVTSTGFHIRSIVENFTPITRPLMRSMRTALTMTRKAIKFQLPMELSLRNADMVVLSRMGTKTCHF